MNKENLSFFFFFMYSNQTELGELGCKVIRVGRKRRVFLEYNLVT